MTYKAEMWDKMQHIMERYNDHMAHCYLQFDHHLNYEVLKRAVKISCDKIPIFKSKFCYNFLKAKWIEREEFDIEETAKMVETEESLKTKLSENFLTQKLDESLEQVKVLLVRSKRGDILNIVLNHMVMDGADIKLFVDLIARSYTNITNGGNGDVYFKNGSRDELQVLDGFEGEERKKVEKLISYSKKAKDKLHFPFERLSKKGLKPFIEKLIIPSEIFLSAKSKAKELGYTINDLIVACFYRAVYRLIDIRSDQTLGVPCMVDLRKYMANGQSYGATNLTSMVICNIGNDIGKDVFETLEKVKREMDRLKENYPGLHGLPLLRKVFKYTPYGLAKFLIGTFFKNPLLGISNIGIVKEDTVNFNGNVPEYLYFTGSIKYPPYYQLALTTYKNEITFTTALYGTINDRNKVKELFAYIEEEITLFCQKI